MEEQVKCNQCCIGFATFAYDGGELVDEGFDGYLDEEFTFCPHCGTRLPDYVRSERKEEKRVKVTGPLSKLNKSLQEAYRPLIMEQLTEKSLLESLIDKGIKEAIRTQFKTEE